MSPKRRPARRRNRPWRAGGWDPILHNESVAIRKDLRSISRSAIAAAIGLRRMIAAMPPLPPGIRVAKNGEPR